MFYVYIIKSVPTLGIYIGFSSNLRKRILQHNRNEVFSTKNKQPWKLAYYEAYKSEKDAREREKQLKYHGKALGQLKRRIKRCISPYGIKNEKGEG